LLWERRYNSGHDEGWGARGSGVAALAADADANVYATGISWGGLAYGYDAATIKYGPDGKELWVARYHNPLLGSEGAARIGLDGDGNPHIAGAGRQGTMYFLVKYNTAGGLLWDRLYEGNSGLGSGGLAVDALGNSYVTGEDPWSDLLACKYSPAGDLLWKVTGDFAYGHDLVYDIALDADGSAYICGTTTVKYSSDGNLLWHKWMHFLTWTPIYTGQKLAVDPQGNVIVMSGRALYKYSPEGRAQWVAVTANYPDLWSDLALDKNGDAYITGLVNGAMTTAKYRADGALLWLLRHTDDPEDKGSAGVAVVLDSAGNVYAAGRSKNKNGDDDFLTMKYSQYGPTQPLKK